MLRYAVLIAVTMIPLGCHQPVEQAAEGAKTPDEVSVEIVSAETRPMEETVLAQGTVSAGQGASARLASPAPGRLLTVGVREGDAVLQGQLLATVDNRPQQHQAMSAAAAVTAAVSQAHSADLLAGAAATDQANTERLASLGVQSAQLDRDNAVELAKTALQATQTDYQRTKAGARPQEIAQADQAVNQAKAGRDRAATELTRVQFLFDKGISARRQLEDTQTALSIADAALESSRQQASLVRQVRPEDLRAADIRVRQAEQALSQAKSAGDAKLAQAHAALQQARQSALQIAVKRQDARAMHEMAAVKRADLAAATSVAATAEIRSPLRGVVTRRAMNPGDMADVSTPILEVTEVRALNLIASVTGEDGQKLRAGMQAHITATDVPNRVFSGTVLNVGQIDPLTNLLSLRLSVSDSRGALRAGTFATAEIVVRRDPRAVVVPKPSILAREGKQVVFVVGHDSIVHQKEVTVGAEHDGLVEVLKGVSSGEKIVRLGQYEVADGTKVHEAEHAEPAPATDAKAPGK